MANWCSTGIRIIGEDNKKLYEVLYKYPQNEYKNVYHEDIVQTEGFDIPDGLYPNGHMSCVRYENGEVIVGDVTKNNPSFWMWKLLINKYSPLSEIKFSSIYDGFADSNDENFIGNYVVDFEVDDSSDDYYTCYDDNATEEDILDLCKSFNIETSDIDEAITLLTELADDSDGYAQFIKYQEMKIDDYE